MRDKIFIISLWVICALIVFSPFIIGITSASDSRAGTVFVFGPNYDHSAVVLPNNSYVHQGENISQNNYYDLSGIYGFSGVLGWWEDEYYAGITYPDKTFNLNSHNVRHTYIDRESWPTGKYYQFDGGAYNKDKDITTSYFGKSNTYVFYVTAPTIPVEESAKVVNVTKTGEIEVNVGGNVTKVPVTYSEEIIITPEPTNIPENQHTIVIPTTVQETQVQPNSIDQYGHRIQEGPSDIQKVTPAPVPVWLPIIGCIGAAYVLSRRKF